MGKICRDDIQVVFSYIPLKSKNFAKEKKFKYEKEEFNSQIESQEEIHKILQKIFKNEEYIDQKKFQQITEEVTSEAFLYVYKVLNLVIDISFGKKAI